MQIVRVTGVIPARLASSRLPRKLLLNETGKPLLQYVWEAACRCKELTEVIIAADSDEVVQVARGFGARCELTGEHPSGTDRVAEVIRRATTAPDFVVNLQGDEPELNPANIALLVQAIAETPSAEMATLATPIRTLEQLSAPSCVKVVRAEDGRALYFSRCPIPFCRDESTEQLLSTNSPWMLHVGIYAYRPDFLEKLTKLPVSKLEGLEKLEQLRALEAGARLQVAVVDHRSVGIDTPDDYARFVERMRVRQPQSGQT